MALRKEVVMFNEQAATLTWRTFRQPSQPSSLLIDSSLVRNVSRDKLVDTDVICLPGGKLADVKRKLEQQPSGFDTITVQAGMGGRRNEIYDLMIIHEQFMNIHEWQSSGSITIGELFMNMQASGNILEIFMNQST